MWYSSLPHPKKLLDLGSNPFKRFSPVKTMWPVITLQNRGKIHVVLPHGNWPCETLLQQKPSLILYRWSSPSNPS